MKEAEIIAPDDNVKTRIPLNLRRIHDKLQKDTELLKLHIQRYHMSTAQFRKRTSELMIPESVYKRYETIVASCTACAKAKPQPARSRVTGIRADEFGEGLFSGSL